MSDIQEELNNRLAKCIKRETGIDLSNSKIVSDLSQEDNAVIQEFGFKCALKVIRRLAKKKFIDLIQEDYQKLEKDATEVGKKLIRFGSKVRDPVDVMNQLVLLSRIIQNLVEDIDAEELLSDPSAVLRLLIMSYLGELKSRVAINSLRPLLFTVGLAQLAIGKDMSWCTSMLALTIEEQFIKKTAIELGIELEEGENYHSILRKLTSHFEEKGIRQSREVLLADSHRKIRNKVLHENWNPSDDEADDIVAHVVKTSNSLGSSRKETKIS